MKKLPGDVEIHAISRQQGAIDRKAEVARERNDNPVQQKGDHHVHLQDMLGEVSGSRPSLFSNWLKQRGYPVQSILHGYNGHVSQARHDTCRSNVTCHRLYGSRNS